MNTYVGTKIVRAEPMGEFAFAKRKNPSTADPAQNRSGYLVVYPDDYESWSPKETFDAAYRLITDDELELVMKDIEDVDVKHEEVGDGEKA